MFLSGLEIDFKAFKKDKRARQGQMMMNPQFQGILI